MSQSFTDLILELPPERALPASPRPRGIASLNHKIRDDAVKHRAVVVPSPRELKKVFTRLGRVLVIQLERHVSVRRVQDDDGGAHAFTGRPLRIITRHHRSVARLPSTDAFETRAGVPSRAPKTPIARIRTHSHAFSCLGETNPLLERRHSDARVDRVEDDRGGARGGGEKATTPMDASARERARGNRAVPRGDDEGDARARRRTNEPRGDSSASEGWRAREGGARRGKGCKRWR